MIPMRNRTVAILIVVILGAVVAFEFWAGGMVPFVDYEPTTLTDLPTEEREYDYIKDGQRIGSYVVWLEGEAEWKGRDAYVSRSMTILESSGRTLEIESLYVFTEELEPLDYCVNITQGDELQQILCVFEGGKVNGTLTSGTKTATNNVDINEGTVLTDSYMVNHWELLFRTFHVPRGKRVKTDLYLPELLTAKPYELICDPALETITINGVDYECERVRVPELNLWLFLKDGEVLKLMEPDKDIEISISD